MALSPNAVAYGAVVVAGLVLLAVGTPGERSSDLQAHLAAGQPVTPAYSVALNQQIAAYAAAVGPRAAPAVADGGGVRLRSVGFDLPASDRAFPDGPGAELVTNNCQSCHSPGMILNQPALTRAEWTGEVNKMLNTYKAPVAEQDVGAIVTYLASLKVAP